MRVAGYNLGDEGPLSRAMATWSSHIYRFLWQNDKAFARNHFFGAALVDCIHKRVKVFLPPCNTACLENVETGELLEFGKIQWRVKQRK